MPSVQSKNKYQRRICIGGRFSITCNCSRTTHYPIANIIRNIQRSRSTTTILPTTPSGSEFTSTTREGDDDDNDNNGDGDDNDNDDNDGDGDDNNNVVEEQYCSTELIDLCRDMKQCTIEILAAGICWGIIYLFVIS